MVKNRDFMSRTRDIEDLTFVFFIHGLIFFIFVLGER